ncbi:helix-hairpin-helix domain-containing protein, partial [Streptomyces chryseus]
MTALPRGATPGSPADDRDAAAPATEPAPTPAVPVRGPAGDVEKPRTGPVTATGADAPDDADAAEHPKDATEDAGTDVQHDDNTPQPDAETAPAGADDEAPDAGAPSGEGGDGAAEASGPVAGAEDEEAMGSGPDAEPGEAVAGADAEATGAGPDAEPGEAVAGADAGPQLSEAEAELAAQRALRERIERRKAEKTAPVEAGAKLSGQAADLLAAVRAVEGGARSGDTPFAAPPPRRVAPAPPPGPGAGPAVERPADRAAVAAAAPEAVTAVRGVLAEGGAPEALAASVAGVLGEQAAQVLRDDPWQLLSVPGVRPEQADGFARALLGAECGPGDERRTAALIGRLLERAAVQGHTVLESGAVRKALAEHKVPDPDEAVEHAVAEGVALVFQDGVDETADGGEPVEVLLGLERYALAEESLADGLARLASTFADEASEAGEWGAGSVPPSAAELIRAVASNGLVTHSGGEAARSEPAALVTV